MSRKTPAADAVDGSDAAALESARLERELRAEQLLAAKQLYEAFPQSNAAFVLGMVYNEQGDLDQAIRYWEEQTRLPPMAVSPHDRAEAFASLGVVLQTKGEYEKAASSIREALRLNPRRRESRVQLAHLCYMQGAIEECLKVLDESRMPTTQAWGLRGQALQRLGRLDEAKEAYQKAIERNPRFAEAHYGLAMTCAQSGDEAKAEEHRRQFQALKFEQQTAGRRIRAEYRPLAITRRSFAETQTHVGWVYLLEGKPELAQKTWLRAAAEDPDNTACRFQLLMLYQKAGRNQDALRVCQEMIRAEPRSGFHYLSLGNVHVRLKQPDLAEAAFLKAVELSPDRAEGCFALAQFYVQAGTNAAAAVRLSRKATEIAPLAPHFYMLSRAQALQGDLEAARAAIAKARAIEPDHPLYREWEAALSKRKSTEVQ